VSTIPGDANPAADAAREHAESVCQACGACCVTFRVSFNWGECDDAMRGWVPVALTGRIDAKRRAMQGTLRKPVRCVALDGQPGQQVSCRIYTQRPSPCRQFVAWDESGSANPRCNKARAGIGLPPLADLDQQVPPTT
jgi:Fe-S-cluster containining protein